MNDISILNSVKKLLGILPEHTEFDMDIMVNINAAMFTLRQLGVGPQDCLFTITSDAETYSDYLGEDSHLIPEVQQYLFAKTKMGFDPPQSSIVAEAIKAMISEIEWRLNSEVDYKVPKEEEEETPPEEPDETPPVEEDGKEEEDAV